MTSELCRQLVRWEGKISREPVPGDGVTLPATLGGYSASEQQLNSVESAAIEDCNQRALEESRK